VARRDTRTEQYFAIAGYYGIELIGQMNDPRVPEFVIVHAARRAAHYALAARSLEEKRSRRVAAALRPRDVDRRTAAGMLTASLALP
jgi:hypothetical protein